MKRNTYIFIIIFMLIIPISGIFFARFIKASENEAITIGIIIAFFMATSLIVYFEKKDQ